MITSIYWRSSWSWWRHVMLVSSYNPHIQHVCVHGSPWNSAFSASFGFWQEPQSTYICGVQSCVWRLPKYWPPNPLSTQRMCTPPAPKAVHNGRTVREWGVNILEDARIGLLQYNLSTTRTEMGLCLCTVRIWHYGGGGGRWSHFSRYITHTEKAFFPWIRPPAPSPLPRVQILRVIP